MRCFAKIEKFAIQELIKILFENYEMIYWLKA